MKTTLKFFAAIAAMLLSFSACQSEMESPVKKSTSTTHKVTFIAGAPETRTTASINDDVVTYSWTEDDEDKFTVYEIVEGVATPALETIADLNKDGEMTLTADFSGKATPGSQYQAIFNSGVKAEQSGTSSTYDQLSDVLVSEIVESESADRENLLLAFKREVAFANPTLKGLEGMEFVSSVKIESTDGTILAADYDFDGQAFKTTGSNSITLDFDESPLEPKNGNFSFYFVTIPVEAENEEAGVNLAVTVTALDSELEEHVFSKTFSRPIQFTKGDITLFNVSNFTEATTKVSFYVNGAAFQETIVPEGCAISFPTEAPAAIAGKTFMGWAEAAITGTQDEAPDFVTSATMGSADKAFHAVFATVIPGSPRSSIFSDDFSDIETGNNSSTSGSGTSLDSRANYFLDKVYQAGGMIKLGGSSSTGSIEILELAIPENAKLYVSFDVKGWTTVEGTINIKVGNDTPSECQYTAVMASDNMEHIAKEFTVKKENPTICISTSAKRAFIDNINIETEVETKCFDYVTSIDTRASVSLSWSSSAAEVTIDANDNVFPTLTSDPENLSGIEYSSFEESVATIDESGAITLVGEGTTTISASFAGDDDHKAAEASYELTVNPARVYHKAYFSINGATDEGTDIAEGESIEFPKNTSVAGVQFMGWTTSPITGAQATAPTYADTETAIMGDADVTYYAVFASESSSSWKKTAISETITNGTYAILTTDGHAFNGTITSGHGQVTTAAFSFDANNSSSSAPAGVCELVFTAVPGGFTMYNASHGYLYASANSSGKLAWHEDETSYWSYGSDNWKYAANSAYLRDYNNGSIRTYGANNGNVIVLAKKNITYADYCTTVVTLESISISGDLSTKSYPDGATVDYSGLTVDAYYSDGSSKTISNGLSWSCEPEVLSAGTTSCTITATFNGITDNIQINGLTVSASSYDSLAELVAAGEPTTTGSRVNVTITDAQISRFFKTGSYTNGIYIQVGEKEIEIYCQNVPSTWEAGGVVSAELENCVWKKYNNTWELCPDDWDDFTYSVINVTGVSVSPASLSINTGETSTLTATVAPANAKDQTVTWGSDDTDVATVDQTGKVTAVAAGTATITVTTTDGGLTATCEVTVSNIAVTGISIPSSLNLGVGNQETLTATITPANATDKSVTWNSDDTDVATVDQTGKVTAIAEGTANITATATDGGLTATCAVTVSDKTNTPIYKLCTSTSDLVSGGKYIIANGTSGEVNVASNESNNNNRKIASATVVDSKITVNSESTILILTLEGSTDAWTLHTDNYKGTNGYLASASSGSNNYCRVIGDKTTGTISFSDNAAVITLQPHTSRNILRYNSSASCFACYSSGQADVYLYKLEE